MNVPDDQYELKGPDADARGVFTGDGFLVKAGSLARRETAPSGKGVDAVHQRLLADGVLEVADGGRYRFVKDHLFDTPSGAAAAVLGRTANGWISWKLLDGRTLSEVKRVKREAGVRLLDDRKRLEILERHALLLSDGKLPTQQRLAQEYALFREKFGTAAFAGLDGEPLLSLMHDLGNKESLVYWLEFKKDDEFRTSSYGSIAGGSALKYRTFRSNKTGQWQAAGDKTNYTKDITVEEAIEIARSHRDQLARGVAILEKLSSEASDEEYAEVQDALDEAAPDVSRLAWGHKYFSLMFPDKLDDYHVPELQRFHLLKLLQLPPEGDGRYVCAGRFVSIAREVGLPMNHLTTTLNRLNDPPHNYWRIGTRSGNSGTSFWPMMRERRCIAVGWPNVGDLSWVDGKSEKNEKLKALLTKEYPGDPAAIGRSRSQLAKFVVRIEEGDIVLAADGAKILGVGKVVGGYIFNPDSEFAHQRPVEWLSVEEWKLPESSEGLQSTVRELGKHDENLLAIEHRIQATDVVEPDKGRRPINRLTGIPGRIQSVLERKGQVILYGPPGTGKTYWAERTAHYLAALSTFGQPFESLDEVQRKTVIGEHGGFGLVRICCFHPGYGYEDFLEGYRPRTIDGQIAFDLRDGVFKTLCRDAIAAPDRNFYLIVDEINRGDIPRIFGELLTILEKDKRGKRIILPVSQEPFTVPRNVFLIGTMNTADRSISLLDAALRRRFGFVELMPDSDVLKDTAIAGIPLKVWFEALNARIREHVGRDARNLQIGHSYLMQGGSPLKDLAMFKRAIRDDVIPLLEEYCYDDFGTLSKILGDEIVDTPSSRVRHELFDDGQENALIQAMLGLDPEILTSSEAIATEESQDDNDDADDEDSDA